MPTFILYDGEGNVVGTPVRGANPPAIQALIAQVPT